MMQYWRWLTLLLSLILILLSLELEANNKRLNDDDDDELIIELLNGKLRGHDNGYYYSYESIPYADPPIGELRLEAPKPYQHNWPDIFNATKEPSLCMQWNQFSPPGKQLVGVEDCLTVSIYRPKSSTQTQFPVIALIHGGAFMFGGAIYNGHDKLMNDGKVILVKINYRLGPLGFLSAEDKQFPGNYGLKDQRLALKWIKSNIGKFNGDSNHILVLGHSAGGASVHLHLLQSYFKNIANAAASLSGTALNPWVLTHKAHLRALKLGKKLGCNHTPNNALGLKECLKTKSATEIVSAVDDFFVFYTVPYTTFGPVIEPLDAPDAFLTQHPRSIITATNFSTVPWLVSYTKNDGGLNAAMLLGGRQLHNSKELIYELNERWFELAPYFLCYKDALGSVRIEDNYSQDLRYQYLGKQSFSRDTYRKVEQMFTDILFKNGIEESLTLHRIYGSSPVYAYLYDNPPDVVGVDPLLANRTVHADDIFLIVTPSTRKLLREDEIVISNNFIKMFTSYAESDSGQLRFGKCNFTNNIGKTQLHLLHITAEGCINHEVNTFP